MIPNTEWNKVIASGVAAAVFSLICVGSFFVIEGMSGGYALAFISFFLAVSSIAVALLFLHRARIMDAILSDPSPLAHWTYPEDSAREQIEREYGEYAERNRLMFILIGGMLGVTALIFFLFVKEGGLETGIILLAVAALLFAVSRLAPRLERRRALCAPHDAIITRQGIVYEGAVYPFRTFLVFRDCLRIRGPGKQGTAALVFSFTQLAGRFIVQPFDVAVPIPPGEEGRARQVVLELGGEFSSEE